ncbi:Chitin binding protein [Mycena venus]|uniref:Chitin binding protein n=1 Tax=Mycena venus TaxID=2733690 RepID=A0A8H6XVB6_9AGAR|nr:Chitin binding protein [Mycena venus]
MVYAAFALLCLASVPSVLGHARVNSPPIRSPGNAFLQKCGKPSFASVQGDPTGHIEEQEPVNAGCDLTLCRGMLFEDQPSSNVLTVKPSQNMAMSIDCTIPHGGPANVSLIDTTTGGSGSIIGGFLATFDDFCPTSGQTPADQSNLQYTLPNAATIGNKCQNPGDCVVQLFWATPDFSQNYYYCNDVVMAAAAPPPPPSTTPATVAAPVTTPAAPPSLPPVTTPATKPAAPSVSVVNGAASAAPSKMVTSVAAGNGAAATGLAAVNGNSTAPVNKTNANAGRRLVLGSEGAAVAVLALIAGTTALF